jgi:hypothetical protein
MAINLRTAQQNASPGDAMDAQLAALRSQIDQLNNATGIEGASARSQAVARYNSLLSQRQRATAQTTANTAQADAQAAQRRILGTAQGGIDRLSNDPTDRLFREYLQGQMTNQVLDPNNVPFANGAPQMQAQQVNYRDPFNAQTIQAMTNEQAAGAGSAETARNQLMRDAALASGGNAFDPSLMAAQAESMGERNKAIANARNQINMVANRENAATQNAASSQNAQFGQQAGMFNTGNQMNATNANYQAGTQARMYNQGQQSGAAGQLGQYNNQRQGMMSDAEGRLIDVVGRQVFRGPETQMQMPGVQLPNFQQYQQQRPATQGYQQPQQGVVGTYQNPSIQAGSRSSVWAGSGQPSSGSGTMTRNFGPTGTGTPIYQQASQHVQPGTTQTPSIWNPNQRQAPGVKTPIYEANGF